MDCGLVGVIRVEGRRQLTMVKAIRGPWTSYLSINLHGGKLRESLTMHPTEYKIKLIPSSQSASFSTKYSDNMKVKVGCKHSNVAWDSGLLAVE